MKERNRKNEIQKRMKEKEKADKRFSPKGRRIGNPKEKEKLFKRQEFELLFKKEREKAVHSQGT